MSLGVEKYAVTQKNIDLVRGLLTRWERGDYYGTGEAFDPQVAFTRTGGGADVLGYITEAHGMDGLRNALAAWTDEWTDVRVAAESYSEVGDRVLVLVRHRAIGKRSGAPLDHLDAWVFSFCDGRIVRWDAYWDPAEAERALRLNE